MLADSQRPDYADVYFVAASTFYRRPAQCTAGSGDRCPGGQYSNGNADPTLCDGSPVYQDEFGSVLLRCFSGSSGTQWRTCASDSLADCGANCNDYRFRVSSDWSPGQVGYAPTAPAYGEYHGNGGVLYNVLETGGQGDACGPGNFEATGRGGQGCQPCDAGMFDDDASAHTPCVACPAPGFYSPAGSTECTPCPPGTSDTDWDPATPCE